MADTDDDELELSDTLEVIDEPKSSARVLAALKKSAKAFEDWQDNCDLIDDIYSLRGSPNNLRGQQGPSMTGGYTDAELDLFWSSFEVMKVAVYARPPQPAVATMFKDKRRLQSETAEILERVGTSVFERSGIHDVMCHVRDDLLFAARGVIWLTYTSDSDGQRVEPEHVDRKDFRHEPARKWCEVGWVARRAWMTRRDMRKRFAKTSGDAYKNARLMTQREAEQDGAADTSRKASVWEVWHKADNKVYWVSEGCDVLLDERAPPLKLKDFFPCPRPAYATLERRSLVPSPDYLRYSSHFNQINAMTSRIYVLIDKVRMQGLIPAGGDIADAVEEMLRSDDDQILIKVPSAALMQSGATGLVTWIPLAELAQAITGLIEARTQLINDFYQLSGISDIMRGATEADETLGAQRLKSQYGSVRVQEKIREMQRIAADTVRIACEIIAQYFTRENILDMSQMEVPTKADIDKRIKEVEKAAEEELKSLTKQAEQAMAQMQQQGGQGQQMPDPAQMQAKFQQQQQAIVGKYAPMLDDAANTVTIEQVMKLLRDDKARSFAFEIATDSTIYPDEAQEKADRNEFLGIFAQTAAGIQQYMTMGEEGAKLAGGMMRFALGPYRAGRELDKLIEDFIDAAPRIAQQAMEAAQAGGDNEELVAAQKQLAEAEMQKARAQMAKVEADSQLRAVEMQRKMMEAQAKAQTDQAKLMAEAEKLRQSQAEVEADLAKTMAEVDKLRAETAKTLASIGLDVRRQELDEYQAANAAQQQQVDNAMAANAESRADRGEDRADRQVETAERTSERQMALAEREAVRDGGE